MAELFVFEFDGGTYPQLKPTGIPELTVQRVRSRYEVRYPGKNMRFEWDPDDPASLDVIVTNKDGSEVTRGVVGRNRPA